VAVDGSDNVVVAGGLDGTLNFGGPTFVGAGLSDAFVVKFDPQGNHVWSTSFGDVGYDAAASVDVNAAGEIAVTGYYEGQIKIGPATYNSVGTADMFLAKFDAQGNYLWSKSFGSAAYDYPAEVRFDGSGNIILAGFSTGSVNFGGGPLGNAGGDDIVVAKFTAAGNHVWSKRFGAAQSQRCESMALDGSGNIWLTGEFAGTFDFGGAPLASAGGDDVYLAKLDAAGNHLFSARYGGSNDQLSWGIAANASGDVAVVGAFLGTINLGGTAFTNAGTQNDAFIGRFGPAGQHLWSLGTGDAAFQAGLGVAFQSTGHSIAVGSFGGQVDFGGGAVSAVGMNDAFITKHDANGTHVWTKRYGDSGFQYATEVAVDSANNIVLIGEFDGSIDFGGGTLSAVGMNDLWIAKLTP
jgi:hypothetical protein